MTLTSIITGRGRETGLTVLWNNYTGETRSHVGQQGRYSGQEGRSCDERDLSPLPLPIRRQVADLLRSRPNRDPHTWNPGRGWEVG